MNRDQVEQMILDSLDGSLSQQDLNLLENELRTNPESLQMYLSYSDIENYLHVENEVNHSALLNRSSLLRPSSRGKSYVA